MLNLIRDNIQSFGVKFIAGAVVLVMVTFGISSYRSQSLNTIVTIDDYEIKIEKYQRAFEQAQLELRQKYKERAADYIKMINLPAQILQQLTNKILLLKSASENGLTVTDKELASKIFSNPSFQTDGRFDEKKYARMLSNNRLDKLGYEQDLREDLLTQKVYRFINSGVLVSHQSIEAEYKKSNTEMEVEVIEFTPGLFADQVTLTAAEKSEYYNLHKSNFQQKSQYVINYFVLGVDDLKDKVIVRQREVQRYYQKNMNSEFSTKNSYHSRHILLLIPEDRDEKAMEAAKKKAEKIYQQLLVNRDKFPALARKYSSDTASAKQGGDLGWVENGTFIKEYDLVVDKLKKNEISEPFLTAFGYHIVELLDKKDAQVKSLADIRQEIEEKIRLNKSKRRLKNKVASLTKTLADQSLVEMAKSASKSITTTKAFDDTSKLSGIGNIFQLYHSLKSKKRLEKGFYNLPDEKTVLVYQVEKVIDPFIKPLDEVRERVEKLAKSEKEQKISAEKLTQYGVSISTKQQFIELAKKLKTNSKHVIFKFSEPWIEKLRVGETFRNEVYSMTEKQIKPVREAERGFLVYLAKKSKDSVDEKKEENLKQMETNIRIQKANIVLNGFVGQMRKKVKIEYNNSMMQALNIQLTS